MPEVYEKFLNVFFSFFFFIIFYGRAPKSASTKSPSCVGYCVVLLFSKITYLNVFVTYDYWYYVIYSTNMRPKSGDNCMSTIMYVANDIII